MEESTIILICFLGPISLLIFLLWLWRDDIEPTEHKFRSYEELRDKDNRRAYGLEPFDAGFNSSYDD